MEKKCETGREKKYSYIEKMFSVKVNETALSAASAYFTNGKRLSAAGRMNVRAAGAFSVAVPGIIGCSAELSVLLAAIVSVTLPLFTDLFMMSVPKETGESITLYDVMYMFGLYILTAGSAEAVLCTAAAAVCGAFSGGVGLPESIAYVSLCAAAVPFAADAVLTVSGRSAGKFAGKKTKNEGDDNKRKCL